MAELIEPVRSLEANARMWCRLNDLSRQLEWPVDGRMQKLAPWEWKIIMTSGLMKHQRVAAGIDGGFVMLGTPTSKMKKSEMMDLLTIMDAFAAERGIAWSDPLAVPVEAYA